MLKRAGFLGGDADKEPSFRLRFATTLGPIDAWADGVGDVDVIEAAGSAWLRWSSTGEFPVRSQALEGLWRLASSRHPLRDAPKTLRSIGAVYICACGAAHGSGTHQDAILAKAWRAEKRGPQGSPRSLLYAMTEGRRLADIEAPTRCQRPRALERSSCAPIEAVMKWARRARLIVAFAAHLRLAKRQRYRQSSEPIPCLGRFWTIDELLQEATSETEEGRSYDGALMQWLALTDLVNGWLAATAPRLQLTPRTPPTDTSRLSDAEKHAAYVRAADLMNLELRLSPHNDALAVAGLQLTALLQDIVEDVRCVFCGNPVNLSRRGWASKPCCGRPDCRRTRDTGARRELRRQQKLEAG